MGGALTEGWPGQRFGGEKKPRLTLGLVGLTCLSVVPLVFFKDGDGFIRAFSAGYD